MMEGQEDKDDGEKPGLFPFSLAMPLLMMNLGGDMMYVLMQRLRSQSVTPVKSQKVIYDVLRHLFDPGRMDTIFKARTIASHKVVYQHFHSAVHASIMRLNDTSMGKLFDLMTMGVKYQIMSCRVPREMLDVSLNHLESIKRLLGSSASAARNDDTWLTYALEVMGLIEAATARLRTMFESVTLAKLNMLRQLLCLWFQDYKIKVTLFLADSIQSRDGSFVMPSGGSLPKDADVPGNAKYFMNGAEVRSDALVPVSRESWTPGQSNRASIGCNVYMPELAVVPDSSALHRSGDAPPTWICSNCTLINPVDALTCKLCSQPTGVSLQPYGIYVKTIRGNAIPLEVVGSDTIADLKQRVERRESVPVAAQRLLWSGIELENEHCLCACGVKKGSTLYLVLRRVAEEPESASEVAPKDSGTAIEADIQQQSSRCCALQ